ncbi:MAG TPA: LysR substrate-binding domain-containing protein [Steroidobacter sp.]|uniref:LysR substrate-binding domain-containing protein n=1 Tax=Steroidobacter sp. TaxID=1978227 RepID=UPI002ED93D40
MLNLRHIEIFRAVMVGRTVSAAAEMMHASQPVVSKTVKHLESRLGFPLFDRVRGRLIPTREANVLYREIQQIHGGIERLEHVIRQLKAGDDAIFCIGGSPSLARRFIPRAMRLLKDAHPRLIIQFDALSVDQVPEYLVSGRGEYVLTVYEVEHPNLTHEVLGSIPMVAVLPSQHALATQNAVSLADLARERLVSFPRTSPHGQIIAQMCEQAGIEFNVSTFVRFAESACAFAANGMGLTIVDAMSAHDAGYSELVVRPLAEPGSLPLFCHRNLFASRSNISTAFEQILRKTSTAELAGLSQSNSPSTGSVHRGSRSPQATRCA